MIDAECHCRFYPAVLPCGEHLAGKSIHGPSICRVPLAPPVLVADHHRSIAPTGKRTNVGRVCKQASKCTEHALACTQQGAPFPTAPPPIEARRAS